MAIHIEITVVPRSGRQEIKQSTVGIKCFLKEAPEHGRANQELIKYLSKKLGLTQQAIEITSGGSGRKKRLKIITTDSHEQILQKLGLKKL